MKSLLGLSVPFSIRMMLFYVLYVLRVPLFYCRSTSFVSSLSAVRRRVPEPQSHGRRCSLSMFDRGPRYKMSKICSPKS